MSASTLSYLVTIANWNGRLSPEIIEALNKAFDAPDYLECIGSLKEPLLYIDSLDKITDALPVSDSDLRRRCIRALRKTCGIHRLLPGSYTFTPELSKPGRRPYAQGGSADVYQLTDEKNTAFAVKAIRISQQDPIDKITKKYCKEVIVCKRAHHPNVLTIRGVAPKIFELCIVTPWMANGDIMHYAKGNPTVNRLDLLIGVTRGLGYLHDNEIVHGDLKSPNILIDSRGSPRICDFGLSSITRKLESFNASTPYNGCTLRYRAPELLGDVKVVKGQSKLKATTKSDIYSLSMVIVEVVTENIPFPDLTDYTIVNVVPKGKRPSKPDRFDAPGITPGVWRVAKKCWEKRPDDRPEVQEVLRYFQQEATNPGTESSPQISFRRSFRSIFD